MVWAGPVDDAHGPAADRQALRSCRRRPCRRRVTGPRRPCCGRGGGHQRLAAAAPRRSSGRRGTPTCRAVAGSTWTADRARCCSARRSARSSATSTAAGALGIGRSRSSGRTARVHLTRRGSARLRRSRRPPDPLSRTCPPAETRRRHGRARHVAQPHVGGPRGCRAGRGAPRGDRPDARAALPAGRVRHRCAAAAGRRGVAAARRAVEPGATRWPVRRWSRCCAGRARGGRCPGPSSST